MSLLPVAVVISGRGSNMLALLDAGLPVSAVISNVAVSYTHLTLPTILLV